MSHYIHPLHQQALTQSQVKSVSKQTPTKNFSKILANVTDLKISKHAKVRMTERNINIDETKWQQINDKVLEAKEKGVTDALVVVDDARLIISAENNTVVTALNKEDTNNKIFTNINGTILI